MLNLSVFVTTAKNLNDNSDYIKLAYVSIDLDTRVYDARKVAQVSVNKPSHTRGTKSLVID